jgi:hypothetical protein
VAAHRRLFSVDQLLIDENRLYAQINSAEPEEVLAHVRRWAAPLRGSYCLDAAIRQGEFACVTTERHPCERLQPPGMP